LEGGPGAVVEYLHLCPGGLEMQGKGCLEIPVPRPRKLSKVIDLHVSTSVDFIITKKNTVGYVLTDMICKFKM
jgi:hypothetical protein